MRETLEFILSTPWNYIGTLLLIISLMFFKPVTIRVENHAIPVPDNVEEDQTLPK